MDFDFFSVSDDLAGQQGPFMSPAHFRQFFLPHMRSVAETIEKPWIFHSDGDIMLLLDDLLTLGMNGIHPIQQPPMDIAEVKVRYGERVCLVGNIDLGHTLTLGNPDEVEDEVEQRIAVAGGGGGYIISSGNSLTDYCRKENVLAMASAVRKYGKYPLRLRRTPLSNYSDWHGHDRR